MTHISSAVRPIPVGSSAKPHSPKTKIAENTQHVKFLYSDVVFGSPSMNCNGTGICKIIGTNSVRRSLLAKSCHKTLAQIAAAPSGKLSLFFFRELLCVKLYRQHFHKGVLRMNEPCRLPAQLSRGLDVKAKQLLPGDYAVIACDGYFRVDVDLG